MFAHLWSKLANKHNSGKIRSVTPRLEVLEERCLLTSSISEFPVTPGSFPLGITAGPDGDLWFTQLMNNQIGEIDPVMHGVTEYTLPTPKSAPMGITTGPDHNVWFTEFAGNKIGTINSTTHAISEYVIPTANSLPGFI